MNVESLWSRLAGLALIIEGAGRPQRPKETNDAGIDSGLHYLT